MPDFDEEKPPTYRPPDGASGPEAIRGDHPFIMQADGRGWLFVPQGLEDGPLPTHYEPHESPSATRSTRSARTRAGSATRTHEDPAEPGRTRSRTSSRPTG